ncbi:MAG: septation protein A [Chromatiales bacterium]|nr:septation protein A [Chromatiales bacterium]
MKLLFDFFPILLFFVAYSVWGIFTATAVAIVAGVAQVLYMWLRHKRVENMHVITLVLIVVLGGATLILRDPKFIMWKVTAVNWAFALAFLASPLIGGRPLIQRMMAQAVELPDAIWKRLNLLWAGFFGLVGLVNIYFARDALAARDVLLGASTLDPKVELKEVDCVTQVAEQALGLCQAAQGSEEIWVQFKLFGVLGMTVVFVIAQAFWLAKHLPPADGGTTDEA